LNLFDSKAQKHFSVETGYAVNLLEAFDSVMSDYTRHLPSDVYIYISDLTTEMMIAGGAGSKVRFFRPV
jgi:hypothetical protein